MVTETEAGCKKKKKQGANWKRRGRKRVRHKLKILNAGAAQSFSLHQVLLGAETPLRRNPQKYDRFRARSRRERVLPRGAVQRPDRTQASSSVCLFFQWNVPQEEPEESEEDASRSNPPKAPKREEGCKSQRHPVFVFVPGLSLRPFIPLS